MTMSLKERIAARKAAEAAASGKVEHITQEQANAATVIDVPSREVSPLEAMGLDIEQVNPDTGLADPVKPEPPAQEVKKPMTFAEKMAEKKRLAEAAAAGNKPPAPTVPMVQTSIPQAPKAPEKITLTPEQLSVIEEEEDSELAQAYSDIALTINKLQYTDDGEPLGSAMNDLKRALKQNISASMLLLDTDIGQMVVALRRYTGTELTEATKEKKASSGAKTRKATTVTLTAEEIEKALATDF